MRRCRQVTVVVGEGWMKEHRLTGESVWEAARTACEKCCVPRGKPNVSLGGLRTSDSPSPSGELVYVFEHCKSSSRLHFGGRVRVAMDLRDETGSAVVARVMSEPVHLCSRPRASSGGESGEISRPQPFYVDPRSRAEQLEGTSADSSPTH
eukprot:m51a1_g4097 hypothetical protein (151) ;mRNA; r:77640-78435